MKKFLAIYLGSPTSPSIAKWEAMDNATRTEKEMSGMKAWQTWVIENKKSILEIGSSLGDTKRVSASGIADTHNQMTGYTIIEAESPEAAAKLFLNHPHFVNFPGDGVEIMECLPIPEM